MVADLWEKGVSAFLSKEIIQTSPVKVLAGSGNPPAWQEEIYRYSYMYTHIWSKL